MLPDEVWYIIASYLSLTDLFSFARCSKALLNISRSLIVEEQQDYDTYFVCHNEKKLYFISHQAIPDQMLSLTFRRFIKRKYGPIHKNIVTGEKGRWIYYIGHHPIWSPSAMTIEKRSIKITSVRIKGQDKIYLKTGTDQIDCIESTKIIKQLTQTPDENYWGNGLRIKI
jgi:hypothetical protein